jgi:hypothetical protein
MILINFFNAIFKEIVHTEIIMPVSVIDTNIRGTRSEIDAISPAFRELICTNGNSLVST